VAFNNIVTGVIDACVYRRLVVATTVMVGVEYPTKDVQKAAER